MTERVLFLDIDGVVLPGRAYTLGNQTKPIVKIFDPCAVALLNKICHLRKFKIVIHSSWLRFYKDNLNGLSVKEWCIGQGIKPGHFHPLDAECKGDIHWRYDRVDEWLSRHPTVTKFVVLDDEPCQDDWIHKNHLIQTDFDEGITMQIYRRLTTEPFPVS